MAKSKGKGKVNEKSLEVLKKSVRAGGRKSTVAKAEKKPATPARTASRSRSRSRSRTPGRSKDVPAAKPQTPAKKKTPARKKASPALKRLDTEKKATKKRVTKKQQTKTKAPTKPKGGSKAKKVSKSVEALVQKLESSLPNTLSTQTSSSSVAKGRKSTSPVGHEPENSGWFSKCVIV